MTGFRVVLRRITPACPTCGGGRTVRTAATGTEIEWAHRSWCRIGRTVALAGLWQDWREPLPVDDRRAS